MFRQPGATAPPPGAPSVANICYINISTQQCQASKRRVLAVPTDEPLLMQAIGLALDQATEVHRGFCRAGA